MKQFLKYVLATMVGMFAMGVILSIMGIVSLAGMMAAGGATATVDNNSVLVINLNGSIDERTEDNPLASVLPMGAGESTGLEDIMKAIANAKENDKIKGIYIEAGNMSAAPASLEEIRNALVDFKKSGKFIVSYGDNYTQGAYYVCSVADTVSINPQGMIEWRGLASQVMYYKDMFEKLGVSMQVVKVGTYKSAVEPFLLSDMSEPNREQISVYESEIWDRFRLDVAMSRNLSRDKLDQLADSAMMFRPTTFYKQEKLVDKIAYSDEVKNMIAAAMKVNTPADYNTISVKDLAAVADSKPKGTSGNIVAVYYAYGSIVQEPSNGLTSGGDAEIVGAKVVEDLKKLADDDDVKAVVMRVNSPGGSAYASEQIWHQVMNIKAKKPIVVSMGDYAASGGYYISCAADWIVAQPTTITGSIGIFGTFPEAGKLLNETLGIHFATVKTNEYADFGDYSRPFTENERAALQTYINNGYDLFTKRCADGRKVKQDSIKVIGEGRVWTGVHAKQIGLVDQLGGLDDAIAVAKKKAKIDDCTIMTYPAKTSFLENLMDKQNASGSYADAQLKATFGEYYDILREVRSIGQRTGIQASLPYYLRWNL